MKQTKSGDYIIAPEINNNIDFYIASFSGFNEMLKSLLNHDPKTRAAIMGASYREIMTLRVLANETAANMRELLDRKTLQATSTEAHEAAEAHPLTYD